MARNRTTSHANDKALNDKERTDKPIRFKAKTHIYWEDWGHMKRVFVAGRIYDGVQHSDGNFTAYSPYYDVSDYVSEEKIEII